MKRDRERVREKERERKREIEREGEEGKKEISVYQKEMRHSK